MSSESTSGSRTTQDLPMYSLVVRSRLLRFYGQLTTAAVDPAVGFRMLGAAADSWCGYSVSGAGVVNGDGFGDNIKFCVIYAINAIPFTDMY